MTHQNNTIDNAGLDEQGKHFEDSRFGGVRAKILLQATVVEAMRSSFINGGGYITIKVTYKALIAIKEVATMFVMRDNAAAVSAKPPFPNMK